MISKVQKWGNSLGIRIPKSVAHDARLHEGSRVDIREEDEKIVITPIEAPVYRLSDLLKGVNDSNLHKEVDFGPREGGEAW